MIPFILSLPLAPTALDETVRCEAPTHLAFNRGLFSKEALGEAVEGGRAEVVAQRTDRVVVRHVHLESWSRTDATNRENLVLFGVVTSTFRNALVRGLDGAGVQRLLLDQVQCEWVTLDAGGRLVTSRATRLEFAQHFDKKNRNWYWQVTCSDGPVGYRFHDTRPHWIQEKLWHISGFLSERPGHSIVPYRQTDAEMLESLVGKVISLAPGLAKQAILEVLENVVRETAQGALRKIRKDDSIRMGLGTDITDPIAKRYREFYVGIGKAMWRR